MRQKTLAAVSLLERAAGSLLGSVHAELTNLQAQRARLLYDAAEARNGVLAGRIASAFLCTMLSNHVLRCALLSADNLRRQRLALGRGVRLARIKMRWAKARTGLLRRARRTAKISRWLD